MLVDIIGSSGIPSLDWTADFVLVIILLVLMMDFIKGLLVQKGGSK